VKNYDEELEAYEKYALKKKLDITRGNNRKGTDQPDQDEEDSQILEDESSRMS
jgi:hypothetical protein